ncbi:Os12g0265201, partial [Oryza sativa Japonica Group]
IKTPIKITGTKYSLHLFLIVIFSNLKNLFFDRHILIQQLIILMAFLDLMRDSLFFHIRLATWASRNVNINKSLVYEE